MFLKLSKELISASSDFYRQRVKYLNALKIESRFGELQLNFWNSEETILISGCFAVPVKVKGVLKI